MLALTDKLYEWKVIGTAIIKKVKGHIDREDFIAWFIKTTERLMLIRNMVPETMWAGYKYMGITGLQEQDLFYAERKVVAAAFKEYFTLSKTNVEPSNPAKESERVSSDEGRQACQTTS